MTQLLGIDIGTLSTKGLLISTEGRVIGQVSVEHTVKSPQHGWIEQDADEIWWGDTVKVIHSLLSHPEADPSAIAGIGVSGLFPALLIADESGQPLRPALLYSDLRAQEELIQFNQRFNLDLTSDGATPKIAWLHRNEPALFKKARFIFSSHNYIVYRLTGAYCLDYKVADSYGGLLDREGLRWREDSSNWAGLKTKRLPTLLREMAIAGRVTEAAARLTGLVPGVPVICGSGDSLMIHIAAGVTKCGQMLLSFGTTGWLSMLPFDLESYLRDPRLIREEAPYQLSGYLASLGSLFQWYRDQFAANEKEIAARLGCSVYQVLDDEANQIPAGSDGLIVLPYFLKRIQTNVIQPGTGAILGLTLSHTSAHLYRGLMESFGYVIRQALEGAGKMGSSDQRIVSTGGGAASPLWRQIISDIIQQPIAFYPEIDPCLGSAYLAGFALGYWDSLHDIAGWLPKQLLTLPDMTHAAVYDHAYARFRELQLKLA